jgi:UDP-glucose 4-epimerase
MEPDSVVPMMEAIRRWSGVTVPNAAARRGLADHQALIAELESLRGTMEFENEPAGFEAALRDCREPGHE